MPKVSFVCPTKNRIAWLPLAIQSLLSQSEKDIEIVVVNDASSDGTREFLDDWAVRDPRVKVIHNEQSIGAGLSRNLGAEVATSDIIGVCDDDDVYLNTRAELTLKWFAENPESELVNFPYLSCDYFDEPIEPFRGMPFDHDGLKKDGTVNYFCNPTAAYKRKAAREMGGYPREKEGVTDDYQFITNWVQAGKKIDFCGNDGNDNVPFVTLHRILPNSMMAKLRGFDSKWLKKKENV